MRFCAICSIYIVPKALGDISTISIFIGGCVFSFTKLVCAAILHCRRSMWVYTAASSNNNTYGQNIALSFGHDVNRTYCTETHSYLCVNSANILRNRCLLAVSRGKLWIFVVGRLEVEPD